MKVMGGEDRFAELFFFPVCVKAAALMMTKNLYLFIENDYHKF